MSAANTPAKFWQFVDKSAAGECWPWSRPLNEQGYGQFKFDGKNWGAHRLAYILTNGAIPAELVIDHLCRNRGCCNPSHMEPVTNAENVLRGEGLTAQNARATHCNLGHPYDEANTYVAKAGNRMCKTCTRARTNAQREVRRQLIIDDPSLAPHGERLTYTNWRCRCAPCKAAWSVYAAERYQIRKAAIETRQLRAA